MECIFFEIHLQIQALLFVIQSFFMGSKKETQYSLVGLHQLLQGSFTVDHWLEVIPQPDSD